MARSNRRIREKRAARRTGTEHAPTSQSLAPHSKRCECASCERKAAATVARAQQDRDKRARRDHAGAVPADYRSDWRVSLHSLVEYFATHTIEKRRNKVTHLDMTPQWVSHLDDVGPSAPTDPAILYEALLLMECLHPPLGRIVRACAIEGRTQRDLAADECMDQTTVSRRLSKGLDCLQELYGGLAYLEQSRQHALLAHV